MTMKTKQLNSKGFTLIELLVVVAVIGLLSTMSIIALNNARMRARDSRRLSDIRQIQTALELYASDASSYPATVTFGDSATGIKSTDGSVTYMAVIPNNPSPRAEGGTCPNVNYKWTYTTPNTTYSIGYCLGTAVGDVAAGSHCATPASISQACSSGATPQ